jgi:hypothetical protein
VLAHERVMERTAKVHVQAVEVAYKAVSGFALIIGR